MEDNLNDCNLKKGTWKTIIQLIISILITITPLVTSCMRGKSKNKEHKKGGIRDWGYSVFCKIKFLMLLLLLCGSIGNASRKFLLFLRLILDEEFVKGGTSLVVHTLNSLFIISIDLLTQFI